MRPSGAGTSPSRRSCARTYKGDLELSAAGYADGVAMSQQMDDQRRSWTERRLVVRSVRQAHAAEVALRARVSKTMTQIEALNPGG